MMKKAKYTVLVKALGALTAFCGLMGLFCLIDAERVARSAWQAVYMVAILSGGICNLLDPGKGRLSIAACAFYAIAAISSVIITAIIQGGLIYFVIWVTALLISFLRYMSAVKASEEDVPQQKKTNIGPVADQGWTMITNTSQSKCAVGIMRQSKVSLSGRAFNIYVDGVKTTSLQNGRSTRLILAPGRHVLGFAVGSNITAKLVLDLSPGSEANIMCLAKGSGIEAALTAVDVCSLASSAPPAPAQQQSGGAGCLLVVGILLLLFALGFLSIRFTVFFFPVK